ncbi:MAG: hypothetical protein JNM62_11960 [Flavobacteriales bacterium]|nr:hypothetical protein [Flavobacteriales bacterium]
MRITFVIAFCAPLLPACTAPPELLSSPIAPRDGARVDITQRTCALYVVLRSAALGTVHFGRDMDDDMVRWNTCSGDDRVACVQARTISDDSAGTVITP